MPDLLRAVMAPGMGAPTPAVGPILPAIRAPELFDAEAKTTGDVFGAVYSDAVARVESYRVQSEDSIQRFLAGEDEDVHAVALAVQKAETSFEMFLQVRNKVVETYQEMMRMQV